MKKLLLTLILLIGAGTLCCQAQLLRRWTDGSVDWTGFRIADPADTSSSYVAYTLAKKRERMRAQHATYHYLDFTAGIIPYMSWVKQEAMDDTELKAIQRDFDVLEYFARQYRDDLLFSVGRNTIKEDNYIERFKAARDEAHATGDYSKYVLSRGRFDVSAIEYEAEARFLGIAANLFADLPFGDQGRLLYPTAGLGFALELGRNRHGFGVQAQLGGAAFRHKYMFMTQSIVPYFGVTPFYRGEIVANGGFHLSLYGGPGISGRIFEIAGERRLIGGPSLCEGLTADFYFGRTVSLSNGHPEQADHFWQLRLNFNQLYNVSQHKLFPAVNLAAGLYFQSRSIKRK